MQTIHNIMSVVNLVYTTSVNFEINRTTIIVRRQLELTFDTW